MQRGIDDQRHIAAAVRCGRGAGVVVGKGEFGGCSLQRLSPVRQLTGEPAVDVVGKALGPAADPSAVRRTLEAGVTQGTAALIAAKG